MKRLISVWYYSLKFKFKLKILKCQIGINAVIDGNVLIKCSNPSSVIIGDNFKLNSRQESNLVGVTNKASFQCVYDGKIVIGNNCGFTSTVFSARSLIKVGDYVKIGGNVRIFDHDYHSLNYENRRDSVKDGSDVKASAVIIEDDVFIGTNSIILKGVKIGARSIIGAGSVVSIKHIPPDSLVVGNPARIIKTIQHK
ncbi:MAG: DapH/DapD/GlmU-related protein [Bacteroidia bacterium]